MINQHHLFDDPPMYLVLMNNAVVEKTPYLYKAEEIANDLFNKACDQYITDMDNFLNDLTIDDQPPEPPVLTISSKNKIIRELNIWK